MKLYYFALCAVMGAQCSKGDVVEGYRQGKEVKQAKLISAIKNQNTLLTPAESPVGIYKQDLVNAGFLASYMIADSLLYKKLIARTIESTMNAIMKDIDGLISILETTKASEDRFEERMAFAAYQGENTLSEKRKKRTIFNPLRRYLNTQHVAGSVMDRKVLSALGFRWVWDRFFSLIEQELVVAPPSALEQSLGIGDRALMHAHTKAYVSRGDALVPLEHAPYSATTGVKALAFLMSPFMALRASLRTGHTSYRFSRLAYINKMVGAGLSEKLFSQGVKTALEFIELGGAVSFFDEANRYQWMGFVVDRRYELLRLLYAYRFVLENPTGEEAHVVLIEDEIREFVMTGYTRTGSLPGAALRQWWSSQGLSSGSVGSWLRYATVAILGIKSAHWVYNMKDQL